MTPGLFITAGLEPALSLLPARMSSNEARALVLAIALHESALVYRRQIAGPARSYLQFETAGIRGVLHHAASSDHALRLCAALDIAPTTAAVYTAIEYNDVLAAGMARLLLWTDPKPLPKRGETATALAYYVRGWRPGVMQDPRRRAEAKARWPDNHRRAWSCIA